MKLSIYCAAALVLATCASCASGGGETTNHREDNRNCEYGDCERRKWRGGHYCHRDAKNNSDTESRCASAENVDDQDNDNDEIGDIENSHDAIGLEV